MFARNDIILGMEDENMDADKVRELRKRSGMTQKAFADFFEMPKRTVENWEGSKAVCSDYLFNLMEYKLLNEGIIKAED